VYVVQGVMSIQSTGASKVCVWRAMIDRLPTRVNLIRRGVNIHNNFCPLCSKAEETMQHLFIGCKVAQKVWDNCDNWLDMSSVRHNDVVSHFRNFYAIGLGRKGNQVWKEVWVAIVNEIWTHRNEIVFQEGRVDAV